MLSGRILLATAAAVVFILGLSIFQRCPHCRRIVRRTRSRRWMRCRHCGRQYNRSIGPLRS